MPEPWCATLSTSICAPPSGSRLHLAEHGRSGLALDVTGEQEAHATDVQRQHDRPVVGDGAGVDLAGRPPHVGGDSTDLEVLAGPQLADRVWRADREPAHRLGLARRVPDG